MVQEAERLKSLQRPSRRKQQPSPAESQPSGNQTTSGTSWQDVKAAWNELDPRYKTGMMVGAALPTAGSSAGLAMMASGHEAGVAVGALSMAAGAVSALWAQRYAPEEPPHQEPKE